MCNKNSQINISFCIISFFPTMKPGSEGLGRVLDPPPPSPGDAELLSTTRGWRFAAGEIWNGKNWHPKNAQNYAAVF